MLSGPMNFGSNHYHRCRAIMSRVRGLRVNEIEGEDGLR